jgi:hypothetical protein
VRAQRVGVGALAGMKLGVVTVDLHEEDLAVITSQLHAWGA